MRPNKLKPQKQRKYLVSLGKSPKPPHVSVPYAPTAKGKAAEVAAKTPPSRHSGGTSGDLTVTGYKPKTPIVPYSPAPPAASTVSRAPTSASKPRSTISKAQTRQEHLVDHYVTHAYKQKTSEVDRSQVSPLQVGSRIEKAKHEVQSLRERLLTHPAVEQANAQGKVVPVKGLAKIHRREEQYHAIGGPKGISSSKEFGIAPRSLQVGDKGLKALQRQEYFGNQGQVTRRLKRGEAGAHAKGEPSTLETLAIASIGIPGIGVGGDVAKLAELGARAIPRLATKEGAARLASKGGAALAKSKAAPVKALEALKSIPSVAREGKEALRELPAALRAGAKAAPGSAKAGAKALPGATGRYAAGGAKGSFKQFSGLAIAGQGHRAGIDPYGVSTRADALLRGTEKALEENPGKVAQTTLRSLPAFITAPAGLALAAGESAVQGSPKPLENTASALGGGTVDILKKLGSGNEKTVQKTIEEEVGLTPYVPVPAVLRKLHGSDVYQAPRGAVRKGVEAKRQGKREVASIEQGMRYAGGKESKAPVPVSGKPGEHYVLRGLGSKLEAGKARRDVALDTTRASAYGTTWGNLEAKGIVGAAHRHGSVSRLAKKMGPGYEAAIWPMAKMGIPHTPKGHALTQQLAEFYGKPNQPPIPGSLTDRMAINAAAETPGLFGDKGHAAMAQANRESAGRLAKKTTHNSERAARIPQNDFTNYLRAKEGKPPVFKPEERVTKQAEKFTSTDEAAKALHNQADVLLAKAEKTKNEHKAAGLRSEAQGLKAEADHVLKGGVISRRGAWAHYDELNAEYDRLRREGHKEAAKTVLEQKKGLYAELKQYTNPRHVLDRSTLKGWSRGMVRDFTKEQDTVASGYGLHKGVYVADKRPVSPVNKAAMVERPFSSRAMHVKTGELARSGEAEARFEAGLTHTVLGPRTRMAYNQLVHDTLNEGKIPVRVGKSYKHVLTETELEHAARTHSLPADSVAIDLGVIKQALIGEHALTHEGISGLLEGMSHGESAAEALKSLPADLKNEVLAAADKKGRKYAVVSRPRIAELIEQFASPKHPNWRKAASVPARLVLNDPAWVLSQLFATGIPIGASLGPSALAHAPRAIKIMADIQRKADPETQARIAAMVGSSAGVFGVPEGAFQAAHDPFSNVRAIRGSSAGKKLWKLANGEVMGKWDRWNNAKMREFAAAVRSSKGFRNWYGGFRGLNEDMAKIAKATKGMKPTARLEYVSRHADFARSLQRDLNRMGGNWNSFTALERKIAPFAMFYPWIRYSLDWTFHVFPLHHPVAAAALAMTGQVNSNELQRIAATGARGTGAKVGINDLLANPLEYAFPVADGQPYPLGGRIAPTLGVVGTTLVGGKPSNILQSVNPILGTGISLATQRNLFTGQELEGSIPQELGNQLYNFSPALRLLAKGTGFRGFGKGPQSALSKAYEETDKASAIRSTLNPTIPQTAENFALRNALSKVENIIGATSSSAQAKIQGDETLSTKERQKIVARMGKEETAAFAVRDKILKRIDPKLAKQSNEEYERYKAAGQEPGGGSSGIYNKGSLYKKGSIYETGGLYGEKGNNKALNYKGESGSHLHLPNISGPLGAVLNPLIASVAGEKAQAATPSVLATANVLAKQGINDKKALAAAQKLSPQQRHLLMSVAQNPGPKVKAHNQDQRRANASLGHKLAGWGIDAGKAAALAESSKRFGVPPELLAAIGKVESTNGTSTLPGVHSGSNSAGAAGPFQVGNGSGEAGDAWHEIAAELWGSKANQHSEYVYHDAAMVAGRYLQKGGATKDPNTWYGAALSYNHADWYAKEIVELASSAKSKLWNQAGGQLSRRRVTVPGKGRYVFPFPQNKGWTWSRTDMGTDFGYGSSAGAPIRALGSGKIVKTGAPGWPGEGGILLKLDKAKGLPSPYIFVYEGIEPTVKAGQRVKKGQLVGKGGITGSIEIGFADASGQALAHDIYTEGMETPQGKSMTNFLHAIEKGKTRVPIGLLRVGGSLAPTSGGVLSGAEGSAVIEPGESVQGAKEGTKRQRGQAREAQQTPAERLKLVNEITEGNLSGLGVPSEGGGVGPSAAQLAKLGEALQADRRKLLRR